MTRPPDNDIPVTVVRRLVDRLGSARRQEPVTFGVPLPEGRFSARQAWTLLDEQGRAAPMHARSLDTWSDGSVRWLLVDARTDVPESRGTSLRLRPAASGDGANPKPTLSVAQSDVGVVVDTGVARFSIQSGQNNPFGEVLLGDKPMLDARTTVVAVTDQTGLVSAARVSDVTVLESNPLRAVIDVNLGLARGPLSELQLRARLEFYDGLATVKAAFRVRNPRRATHPGGFWDLGDSGSLFVRDLCLTLARPASTGVAVVDASIEPGIGPENFAVPFELYQDSSGGENWQSRAHLNRERRVPNKFRGYRIKGGDVQRSGLRATPVVQLGGEFDGLAVAVPHFWQNFPRAVEADDRTLTVRFFPRQYDDAHELQGGEQKTHVCFVSFGADRIGSPALDWCRTPVVACAEPAWFLSAAAVPWLARDDRDHAELIASAANGPDSFEHKREVVDEYGWRHFGEVWADHEAVGHKGPSPLVSHYNNQYDPIAGFIYQYLRTGDTRWWTMADELAAHVVDIDIYHTDRDKWCYNRGLFWHTYHYGDADTSTHRTYPRAGLGKTHGGGPSVDQNYTTGLMLHYYLTGDEASRGTVADSGQYVVDADDGRKTIFRWLSHAPTGSASASGIPSHHGPGRGPANGLNSLLDAHRLTGDERLMEKAEEIIRRVVHPAEDVVRRHQLDDPENRWFYLMFLQSLGKYLWRKAELGRLDRMYTYGRETLLHYARWMADHEYPYLEKPEKLEYPTETWAAHEARKSDVFCLAALHSAGAERERFTERARFFFRNAVETLRPMPTRTLARPVIVLLSSGLLLPWMTTMPDASLPAGEPAADFGAPTSFVPQREIAIRRAKLLAALGGVVILAGLAGLIWWVTSHL
jgi:hypothetical protein